MNRLGLTLLTLALFGLVVAGMWAAWRRRARAQGDLLPLPALPAGAAGAAELVADGVYVGTTYAGDWQARVIAGGLSRRAAGTLTLDAAGVLIDRDGEEPVFLPATALRAGRTDRAHAGKVMTDGGLVVLTWEHRGIALDTGFRADDHDAHGLLADGVTALVAACAERTAGAGDPAGEST